MCFSKDKLLTVSAKIKTHSASKTLKRTFFKLFWELVESQSHEQWRPQDFIYLSPGQTLETCQRNISQHCWPPCCDVLRHVGCCWLKFENGQISANNSTCNTSQQGDQTRTTFCTQQCCAMLRWHVAIVWPGLYSVYKHSLTCVHDVVSPPKS